MSERIKLIWDFRGDTALQIAKHHAIHLSEYVQREKFENVEVGSELRSQEHAIAYLIVDRAIMITIRDVLRPHRGELV